jgi:hypothetical protein
MLPGPAISTSLADVSNLQGCVKKRMANLLMPAEEDAHRLTTTLRAAKTSTTRLGESSS